jgi:hypothetical protein
VLLARVHASRQDIDRPDAYVDEVIEERARGTSTPTC